MQDLVRNTLMEHDGHLGVQLKEAIFEPKMTRSKLKEVIQKGHGTVVGYLLQLYFFYLFCNDFRFVRIKALTLPLIPTLSKNCSLATSVVLSLLGFAVCEGKVNILSTVGLSLKPHFLTHSIVLSVFIRISRFHILGCALATLLHEAALCSLINY